MNNTKLLLSLIVTLSILFLNGCSSTENITQKYQILSDSGPIRVFLTDSTIYRLDKFAVTDSSIMGSGALEMDSGSSPFMGELKFTEISAVQTHSLNIAKTVVGFSIAAYITMRAISYIPGRNGLFDDVVIISEAPNVGGGGTSCPFLYSWSGERYVLDAEAFGIALGKPLEMKTSSMLPSLKEKDGVIKIKIANERLETHYINSVDVIAGEIPFSQSAAVDTGGKLWAIISAQQPVMATEHIINDALQQLTRTDGVYWESSLSKTMKFPDFEDTIDVSFVNPHNNNNGSFILTAINTNFSSAVLDNLTEFLGDKTADFYYAVDNNPAYSELLRAWIEESSLKLSMWNGTEWVSVGKLHPEATETPFTKIMRFTIPEGMSDTVTFRLTGLQEVWNIDAANIDWTPVQPLKTTSLHLVSAIGPLKNDVAHALSFADKNYVTLFPPDSAVLQYQAFKPSEGNKAVYVTNVQGYLHEWIQQKKNNKESDLGAFIPAGQRVEYLKYLLQHKSIFLPPVYAHWFEMKK